MKKSLKILNYIGATFIILYGIFVFISIGIDLFTETQETLLWLGGYITICLLIWGVICFHNYFIEKKRIDWDNNKSLKVTVIILGIITIFLSIETIILSIPDFHSDYGIMDYPLKDILIFGILSILSGWTYFSLIMAKNNALLIFRSYIILMLILICMNIFKEPFVKNDLIPIILIFYIINIAVLSLCIKGLILSFSKKWKNTFSEFPYKFWQIFIVILIFGLVLLIKDTEIVNDIINLDSLNITDSKYPPLEVQ